MDIITLVNNDFKSPEVLSNACCEITPKIAQQMLQKNTDNIPPNIAKARLYASVMIKGDWLLNGDTIRFDKDGVLLDGQNRLIACIDADISFKTAIVVGLDSGVFNTIDQGRVRSKANLLARLYSDEITKPQSTALSSAIPKIIFHDAGYAVSTAKSGSGKKLSIPSVDEIDNWIKENPTIIADCLYVFDKLPTKALISKSEALFFLFIGKKLDEKFALQFFNKTFVGNNIEEGETIGLLRNLILTVKSKQTRMSPAALHNCIIKIWNSVGTKGLRSIVHSGNIRWRNTDVTPFMKAPKENCIEQMLEE